MPQSKEMDIGLRLEFRNFVYLQQKNIDYFGCDYIECDFICVEGFIFWSVIVRKLKWSNMKKSSV